MDNFLKALDSSVYLVTTCLYRSCNCLTSPGLKVSVSESMKGNLAPVVYQFEHYDYEQQQAKLNLNPKIDWDAQQPFKWKSEHYAVCQSLKN